MAGIPSTQPDLGDTSDAHDEARPSAGEFIPRRRGGGTVDGLGSGALRCGVRGVDEQPDSELHGQTETHFRFTFLEVCSGHIPVAPAAAKLW